MKLKLTVKGAKGKKIYEEHLAKNIKASNKNLFKHIKSRKPAREQSDLEIKRER